MDYILILQYSMQIVELYYLQHADYLFCGSEFSSNKDFSAVISPREHKGHSYWPSSLTIQDFQQNCSLRSLISKDAAFVINICITYSTLYNNVAFTIKNYSND